MQTAHPTVYNGINFRSRAEARWAAFFDELGIPWDYELLELSRYIPDFTLFGGLVLCEVKGGELCSVPEVHVEKIWRSGWSGPWIIVGGSLRCEGLYYNYGKSDSGDTLCGTWDYEEHPLFSRGNAYDIFGMCVDWNAGLLDGAWRRAGNQIQWKPWQPR